MSTPLDFLDDAVLTRKATSVITRLTTLGDIAQRAALDIADFAEAEVQQLGSKLDAVAREGEPDAADLRAALVGNPDRFEARLAVMRSRAQAYREQADLEDVGAATGLRDARRRATALVVGDSSPRGMFASLIAALTVAAQAAPPPPPDDLRRSLVEVARVLVRVEASRRLAELIEQRASARVEDLRRYRRSLENLQQAMSRVPSARSVAPRFPTLPYDLVLDSSVVAQRLRRAAGAVDAVDLTLSFSGEVDPATALLLVEKTVEDMLKRYQLPFVDLLPLLLGDHSPEQVLDTFVRNASPLAPVRPREGPDSFTGLSIGVVEARDEGIGSMLAGALGRARDVAILTVQHPDLPPEVQARVLRFKGILPSEALVSVVLDLYERTGSPTALGMGATRDWEGDLPALVTEARLQREIRARKMRGASTARVERWLPRGVVPAAEPPPVSVDEGPVSAPPLAEGDVPEAK